MHAAADASAGGALFSAFSVSASFVPIQTLLPLTPGERISAGGEIIHELGTVRMGTNPAKSALNGFCQAHEVKNLFVTDAACFVSNPDKNPTLTIMALSWRASDYLADEAKKGNL